ncbi:hypothetical protein FHS31_002713 [Sphingomonas vulcanisoli]|uniref:Glycosyltransferase RgtA/B/C/D-like domain-containing protein n=1 Tax=Sphingomonas vulcanisoli TaxID=1658060 RepID=A0ABX0TUF0_9SPHN|nr:hypothetical protein [Sphingomonas vulcanisoli]NIJ09081.1 hypothetical protein [Sphingomonas vulcanisoli]
MFRPQLPAPMPPRGWWNSRWYCMALVIVTTIPLLYPTIPPFTDLPGHMGRYAVELADPASPLRSTYYNFHWRFLANLGVDIAIIPMAKLFGLELGLKLIVITIPAMVTFGILWIAREAHGRVPPTALFALPLAYGFPLIWGFLNYSFAMALALNAFALWLRLGRMGLYRWRNILFVPIGLLLTVAHVFGWATLCLLCYAAEVVRARDDGRSFFTSLFWGGIKTLALAPPLILLLVWRSGDASAKSLTGDFFFWRGKYVYIISSLRTHWMNYDIASVYILWGLIACGLAGIWVRMNRTLGIASLMLMIAYCLLPRILLNSAYADMRLAPYVLMIAVAAITLRSSARRENAIVALIATALFGARLAMLTASFAEHDDANRAQLVALDHVKPGSRVFVEVALQCLGNWETTRMDHLGSMAIVRRGAFANGQWVDPGAQLLSIKYAPAKGFSEDPTQILRPFPCRQAHAKVYPGGLNHLPHDAFDYVWLIAMARDKMNSFPGLTPIWIGDRGGILYRVEHSSPERGGGSPQG